MVPVAGAIVVPASCTAAGQDLIPDDQPIPVTDVSGVSAGDLLMLCNFGHATLFQVTGFSGAGGNSIEHDAGGSPWENETDTLEYLPVPADACDGDLVSNEEGSVVAQVRASRWYVGCNGDVACDAPGGRSLFRASLVNNAGTPGVAVDEISAGVDDMQLEYLLDGATDYVGASAVADWNDPGAEVVAVRVTLRFVGEDAVGVSAAGDQGELIARELVHTVSIRNRSP
jgi:type IV pilus assembly protein PilW